MIKPILAISGNILLAYIYWKLLLKYPHLRIIKPKQEAV